MRKGFFPRFRRALFHSPASDKRARAMFPARSDFCVHAQAENVRRTAVAVVAGVLDALVPERYRPELVHADAVEGLEDALGAIVQPPIAEKKPDPASRKVIAVRPRQAVQVRRQAEL